MIKVIWQIISTWIALFCFFFLAFWDPKFVQDILIHGIDWAKELRIKRNNV